ncbi:MAG: hypothetical protein KDJ99_33440 [Candidatus Competibacteraceae bacterium]|nr:hypothetical protein [Candidatus Competibacteraceae bacterium]
MKDRLQELNGMCLMLAAALFGVIVALVVSVEDVKKTAIITPLVIALYVVWRCSRRAVQALKDEEQ